MRHIGTILALAALCAAPVAAQAPRPAAARAPMLQSITFDVVGAFDERWRVQLEPLVFGRFSIGLSGSYTTQYDGFGIPIALPAQDPCPITTLCTTGQPYGSGPPYKAWSVDLSARWYPASLSLGGRRQSVAVYLGEFVGYHHRRYDAPIYYGCPTCASPQPADTLVPPPGSPLPPPYGGYTQTLKGLEPGVEIGLRVLPARHVVIDVGGRFRLATLEDPMQRLRPGDLDSRLVVAVGVGW